MLHLGVCFLIWGSLSGLDLIVYVWGFTVESDNLDNFEC